MSLEKPPASDGATCTDVCTQVGKPASDGAIRIYMPEMCAPKWVSQSVDLQMLSAANKVGILSYCVSKTSGCL